MAEDENRANRSNKQGTGASAGQQKPFTLSQLERTEKPADFTVADLDARSAGAAKASHPTRSAQTSAQPQPAQPQPRSAASASRGPRTQAFPRQSVRETRRPVDHPVRRSRVPRARRMKLSVTKISPWSVAKVAFMLSIAMGIIQTICVAILYAVIDAAGVFDKISSLVSQTGLASNFNVSSILSMGQVLSAVVIFSVFEVVLLVLLSVIFTFLYNVVSSLVGGVHVTLGDD